MEVTVPQDFEEWPLGGGFAEVFGSVYVNHATRAMGFRVAPRHLNPVGVCNGGAMATFADMQIAAVIAGVPSGLPKGISPRSVSRSTISRRRRWALGSRRR
jgi:hypothetical protein